MNIMITVNVAKDNNAETKQALKDLIESGTSGVLVFEGLKGLGILDETTRSYRMHFGNGLLDFSADERPIEMMGTPVFLREYLIDVFELAEIRKKSEIPMEIPVVVPEGISHKQLADLYSRTVSQLRKNGEPIPDTRVFWEKSKADIASNGWVPSSRDSDEPFVSIGSLAFQNGKTIAYCIVDKNAAERINAENLVLQPLTTNYPKVSGEIELIHFLGFVIVP